LLFCDPLYAVFALIDNHIPHVVLIGQSAKELGNNIHTAKVTYANSMEAAVNVASTYIFLFKIQILII
jgi:UDP-N-acetylmuramoylalanine-D-glutamate ligase